MDTLKLVVGSVSTLCNARVPTQPLLHLSDGTQGDLEGHSCSSLEWGPLDVLWHRPKYSSGLNWSLMFLSGIPAPTPVQWLPSCPPQKMASDLVPCS
jgi:hypothetical protein